MDMKREYCCADFKRVIDFLKEKVPGVTFGTDIICGFPGETHEDFEQTMELVRQYHFPSLFINQFYPRPGTPAAKMEQVSAQVKKQRTKELSALFHSYNPYDHKVLVLVPKKSEFKGKMIEVDIYEAGKHHMKGRPVEDAQVFTPSIAQPLQNVWTLSVCYVCQQHATVKNEGAIKECLTERPPLPRLCINSCADNAFIIQKQLPEHLQPGIKELKTVHQNGVHAPVDSSTHMGWSWRFMDDRLKLLSLGLALAAIIVALVIEKFH